MTWKLPQQRHKTEAVKQAGVTDKAHSRWRKRQRGPGMNQAKRLRDLQAE